MKVEGALRMGTKKKTVRGAGYSKLLPQDKDLYIQNIIKSASSSKSISPLVIGPSILRVNDYYSFKAFTHLDAAVESDGVATTVDLKYVYGKLGLNCTSDEPIATSVSSSPTDKFYYRMGPSTGTCNGGLPKFGNFTYSGIVELPNKSLSGQKYQCDGTLIGPVTVPGIEDSIFSITIKGTGDDTTYRLPYSDTGAEVDLDKMTFLTAVYKANFIKNEDRLIKAVNARMGIPNRTPPTSKKDCTDWDAVNNVCKDGDDTFEGALSNKEYKHIVLTYCVPYEDPYKKVIDTIYGKKSKRVEVTSHGITLTCGYETKSNNFGSSGNYCDTVDAPGDVVFRIDGVEIDLGKDDENQFLIPMEYFASNRTLREKHDDISKSLTMIILSEKTVKVKWYQTGFFRIFTWVVAIGLAAYGNPTMLIGMATSTVVAVILGDKLGAIFALVMAVYTFGTSLSGSINIFNTLSKIADISSKIMSLYFQNAYDKIAGELEEVAEGTKETKDAIDEMTHEMLYLPIGDAIDTIYQTMYDLMYNGAYDQIYNYSNFTKVNHLMNTNKGYE